MQDGGSKRPKMGVDGVFLGGGDRKMTPKMRVKSGNKKGVKL